jgi:hypothetical protein
MHFKKDGIWRDANEGVQKLMLRKYENRAENE